jgi:hypothetical protein
LSINPFNPSSPSSPTSAVCLPAAARHGRRNARPADSNTKRICPRASPGPRSQRRKHPRGFCPAKNRWSGSPPGSDAPPSCSQCPGCSSVRISSLHLWVSVESRLSTGGDGENVRFPMGKDGICYCQRTIPCRCSSHRTPRGSSRPSSVSNSSCILRFVSKVRLPPDEANGENLIIKP